MNMAIEAGFRALDELKEGRDCIVILMPKSWGAVAFDLGKPPEGVYLRFSSDDSSLKSLAIQTLIIVTDDHPEDSLALVRQRLRGQLNPRIIHIPSGVVLNGAECFQ